MKISKLILANALMVNNHTEKYLTDEQYNITLDGVIIWVECKRSGHKIFTSLFNVPYGEALVESQKAAESSPRVSKKTTK